MTDEQAARDAFPCLACSPLGTMNCSCWHREHAGYIAGRAAQREEDAKLREFAVEICNHHLGSIDGCDIQDIAVRYGVMEVIEVSEPCDPEDEFGESSCECAKYGDFPQQCYRLAAAIRNQGE